MKENHDLAMWINLVIKRVMNFAIIISLEIIIEIIIIISVIEREDLKTSVCNIRKNYAEL